MSYEQIKGLLPFREPSCPPFKAPPLADVSFEVTHRPPVPSRQTIYQPPVLCSIFGLSIEI